MARNIAAPRLDLVASTDDVLDSLRVFNRDLAYPNELAKDLMRRTQYWVFDAASEAFGPSKFVGFSSMTYPLYELARAGDTVGEKFDGFRTRSAIERVAGSFASDRGLVSRLEDWAKHLVGDTVFDGVDRDKWRFVTIGVRPPSVLDAASWSRWLPLLDEHLSALPDEPGVYLVRVVTERPDQPHTLRRCVGDDHRGLLDVGESNCLRQRLRDLLRCMRDPVERGHMAGWRYAFLGMHRLYPLERLQFCYRRTPDKKAAYTLEGKVLDEYVRRHYELPPLNYKFNWAMLDRGTT